MDQSARAERLRSTGLDLLGEVPWGTHLAIFYDTRQDLLDTVAPYFEAGLDNNEICLWAATAPFTASNARATLGRAAPGIRAAIADGRMKVLFDWYLKHDLKSLVGSWQQEMDAALERGADGIRISGNAYWIQTTHRDGFLAFERELDIALEGQRMLVLCTYPLAETSSTDVIEVTRAHQMTAVRRGGEWNYIEASRSPIVHSLTLREMEVLSWVARGKSAWEIGKILGITKRTVDEHARSAAHKLGAANRAEASAIAVSQRIIELDPQEPRRRR